MKAESFSGDHPMPHAASGVRSRQPQGRRTGRRLAATTLAVLSFLPTLGRAQTDVSATLEPIRQTYNLPGLSVLVLKKGRIIAQGATGVRRVGAAAPLLVTDRLNFASCTKFMTASIAARLVDRGLIQWNSKIRDYFPENISFNTNFLEQTLDNLLAHRAGVEQGATFENRYWDTYQAVNGTPQELRTWVCDRVLMDSPEVGAGTYLYSNQGYTVAARMLEVASGKTWEQLVDEEVFKPLRLTSASLGVAYTDDAVNPIAPVGHDLYNGSNTPIPRAVFTPAMLTHYQASNAPGGFVVCTLADYAKFLHYWIDGADSTWLTTASRTHILTPWGGAGTNGYAHGVVSEQRNWADPSPALTHDGDIFGHDTVFWGSAAHDIMVVVFTNCAYNDRVDKGMDTVAAAMIAAYTTAVPAGPAIESPSTFSTSLASGNLALKVNTLPSVSYHLQHTTDLSAGVWADVSPIQATDWTTTFTFPVTQTKEYFRVKVEDP